MINWSFPRPRFQDLDISGCCANQANVNWHGDLYLSNHSVFSPWISPCGIHDTGDVWIRLKSYAESIRIFIWIRCIPPKKWPPKDHNGYSLFYLSSEKTSTNQTEVGKRTFFDMGKKLIHYCWCFTSGLHKGLSIMHQHSSQEGDMKLNFNWLVERKNRRK